ncbi:hypothetical protein ACOSQ4_005179 [Xanthoceras sorbifolium]
MLTNQALKITWPPLHPRTQTEQIENKEWEEEKGRKRGWLARRTWKSKEPSREARFESNKKAMNIQLYQHLHDPTNQDSLIWTFLQWFLPLSTWRQDLTKLMGNHNIWKMDDHMSNKITCIFIFHRPYMFNTNTKLLWTINNAYEYQSVYDMDVQWPAIYPSLMEFFCEANGLQPDYPHHMFLLPDVHTPPPYFQDSQDPMDLDPDVLRLLDQPDVGPSQPWYKSLYGDVKSDDDYDNNNLSPSQNSM